MYTKKLYDGETEMVNILTGVLQGDTLTSYLFVIVQTTPYEKIYLERKSEPGISASEKNE